MPQLSVEDLLAKQEITELLYRYCRGIDRLDWDLVRSCYHPDAFDDHGLVRGGVDEFVAFFTEMLTPMIATTHMLGNILISVDGDVAGCESQILAWHRIPADDDNPVRDLTAQARYVDRIERRNGEWRIAHRSLVFDWTRLEPAGEEFPIGPDGIWGRRDRDDLSYRVLEHRTAHVGG